MTETVCKDNITELLGQWQNADKDALDKLSMVVYGELKRRAKIYMHKERPGHTLETAALVNEVFLNLFDADVNFVDRQHFFALASRTMRRILVDHARNISCQKRGANVLKITLNTDLIDSKQGISQFLLLNQAFEALIKLDVRKAEILELETFAGLSTHDIAELLLVSVRTVERELKFSKAWISNELA